MNIRLPGAVMPAFPRGGALPRPAAVSHGRCSRSRRPHGRSRRPASTRPISGASKRAKTSCATRSPRSSVTGVGPEVLQDDAELPPVVGIDRRRAVRKREPVPEGQARARPHLALDALGELHHEARAHEPDLPRRERDRAVRRAHVVAGRVLRGPLRKREVRVRGESGEADAGASRDLRPHQDVLDARQLEPERLGHARVRHLPSATFTRPSAPGPAHACLQPCDASAMA
jgi:hypothetical protein